MNKSKKTNSVSSRTSAQLDVKSCVFGEDDQLLRLCDIIDTKGTGIAYLPFSRSTFYNYIALGLIPRGIKLGPRITVYKKSGILAFIEQMEAAND